MERVIMHFVTSMLHYKIIDEEQQSIIIYGLDLLFSSLISLISFFVFGIILHKTIETFWILAVFIPLQSFGGGYHCKIHFRCWMLMISGYFLAIYGLLNLPIAVLWGGALFFSFSFFIFAPVENPKALFGESFKKKMKKIENIVYLIVLIIAVIFWRLGLEWERPILTAVLLSGISIVCAKTIIDKKE